MDTWRRTFFPRLRTSLPFLSLLLILGALVVLPTQVSQAQTPDRPLLKIESSETKVIPEKGFDPGYACKGSSQLDFTINVEGGGNVIGSNTGPEAKIQFDWSTTNANPRPNENPSLRVTGLVLANQTSDGVWELRDCLQSGPVGPLIVRLKQEESGVNYDIGTPSSFCVRVTNSADEGAACPIGGL